MQPFMDKSLSMKGFFCVLLQACQDESVKIWKIGTYFMPFSCD